jgi:Arc/MetJ family transcription regulator
MGITTSKRVDTKLVGEAVKILKVKTRTEAVHIALKEAIGLRRFKRLTKKNAGKLKFSGCDS